MRPSWIYSKTKPAAISFKGCGWLISSLRCLLGFHSCTHAHFASPLPEREAVSKGEIIHLTAVHFQRHLQTRANIRRPHNSVKVSFAELCDRIVFAGGTRILRVSSRAGRPCHFFKLHQYRLYAINSVWRRKRTGYLFLLGALSLLTCPARRERLAHIHN